MPSAHFRNAPKIARRSSALFRRSSRTTRSRSSSAAIGISYKVVILRSLQTFNQNILRKWPTGSPAAAQLSPSFSSQRSSSSKTRTVSSFCRCRTRVTPSKRLATRLAGLWDFRKRKLVVRAIN